MSRAKDLHSLNAAFSQFARVAACTDTVFIGFQGVFASAGLLTTSSGVPSQPRCSRPLLRLRAPVLARQLRCRNLQQDDATLNQFVGPLQENSLARCWRRPAAQPSRGAAGLPAGAARSWFCWQCLLQATPSPSSAGSHLLSQACALPAPLPYWPHVCLLQC